MNFKDILNKVYWLDVELVIKNYYNEENSMYEGIFNELKELKEEDCENMRLYVEECKDFDGEVSIQVIGRNGSLNKESSDFEFFKDNVTEEYANSETTYALEMTRWEKWLDMNVPFDVISKFSLPEIVAHSLIEMTFLSFSQEDIQGKCEDLSKIVEDIKSGKTICKTFNTDDFLNLFDEDIEENDNKEEL
jgi:hypothetical protein